MNFGNLAIVSQFRECWYEISSIYSGLEACRAVFELPGPKGQSCPPSKFKSALLWHCLNCCSTIGELISGLLPLRRNYISVPLVGCDHHFGNHCSSRLKCQHDPEGHEIMLVLVILAFTQ